MPSGRGRRATHTYPHGKPFRLWAIELSWPVLFALCIWWVPSGFQTVSLVVIFAGIAFLHGAMVKRLERSGHAVPIPGTRVKTEFPAGLPKPLFFLRIAFFSLIVLMLIIGMLRLNGFAAEHGITACILGMVAVGFGHFVFEAHYRRTGRAVETESNPPQEADRDN
jgi:hypothetical protein